MNARTPPPKAMHWPSLDTFDAAVKRVHPDAAKQWPEGRMGCDYTHHGMLVASIWRGPGRSGWWGWIAPPESSATEGGAGQPAVNNTQHGEPENTSESWR